MAEDKVAAHHRSPHRVSRRTATALVAAIALALGVLSTGVWMMVMNGDDAQPEPRVTPPPRTSPPPLAIDVTLRLDVALDVAPRPAGLSGCYEPWDPAPVSDHGISVEVGVRTDERTEVVTHYAKVGNVGEERIVFLSHPYGVVLVQDGMVVGTTGLENPQIMPIDLEPGERHEYEPGMLIDGSTLCATRDRFSELLGQIDFDTATPEQIAAFNAEVDEFFATSSELPSGEYQIYAWAPVVLGTQAAAVQQWLDEGYSDLGALKEIHPDNPLLREEILEPYCSEVDPDNPFAEVAFVCATIPDEVWAEVLTRTIPLESIRDTDPFVVISEPITLVVD